jgi:hypothetical protein
MDITKTKEQIAKERKERVNEYVKKYIANKVKLGVYKHDRHTEEGKKRQLRQISDWIYKENALLCVKKLFGTSHLI